MKPQLGVPRLHDGAMRTRAALGAWVIALALLALPGCSVPPSDVINPSHERSSPALVVDATFTCIESFKSESRVAGRDDLHVGPLTYANGAALAQTTLADYFAPESPQVTSDGGYFLKMGAYLPPGESLTIRVDPASGVKIVGAAGAKRGATVRYESCPDRASAWVGGLELEKSRSASCASLEYRTASGTSGRMVASIFAGRCGT